MSIELYEPLILVFGLAIVSPPQADTDVMRVACQAPAAAPDCLVLELKPEREDERHHQCEKRLAVSQQLNVGCFVLKIDNDGPVFSHWFGHCAHGSFLCRQVL